MVQVYQIYKKRNSIWQENRWKNKIINKKINKELGKNHEKNTYISNEKIFYKNLITTLKTIRNEKGLTQEYVAKSIDIS